MQDGLVILIHLTKWKHLNSIWPSCVPWKKIEVVYKRTKVWHCYKNQRGSMLAEQVRKKRYADESVKLTHADDRKL